MKNLFHKIVVYFVLLLPLGARELRDGEVPPINEMKEACDVIIWARVHGSKVEADIKGGLQRVRFQVSAVDELKGKFSEPLDIYLSAHDIRTNPPSDYPGYASKPRAVFFLKTRKDGGYESASPKSIRSLWLFSKYDANLRFSTLEDCITHLWLHAPDSVTSALLSQFLEIDDAEFVLKNPDLIAALRRAGVGESPAAMRARETVKFLDEFAQRPKLPPPPKLLEVTPEMEAMFLQLWMRFQQAWNARDWAQMAALYVNTQVTPPAPVKQSNGQEMSWADFMAVVKRNRENEGEITTLKVSQIELQETEAEVDVKLTFSKARPENWGRKFVKSKDGRWLFMAR